jgi:hypothetical protein
MRECGVDISLITSLFRAEVHLDGYARQVREVAAQVQGAGRSLEVILVANEPAERERDLIRELAAALEAAGTARAMLLEVPRESLYASWNRGVRVAAGRCVGFWNVDDMRTAGALLEGFRLIEDGCALVYFPYDVLLPRRVLGRMIGFRRAHYRALPYDRAVFTQAMRGASFFLFARELYDRVGPFDEHFLIAGDFEWCARASDVTDFCAGTQLAGTFRLHGGNLSDTGNPLQQVEENIVHLRRGAWESVRPAEPGLMCACWEEWGYNETAIPPHIHDLLWDDRASDRWQSWLRERRRAQRRTAVSEALRAGPRFVINHTGLRPWLARLGVVKSATVDH